jgi:hypothetical protein
VTAAADLAATDLVAAVRTGLLADTDVRAALTGSGTGNAAAQVTARNEAPFPHVRITDPVGGDLRTGRRLISTLVQVEVLGDPDGSGGKAALAAIARTLVGALASLPDLATVPGQPVITGVDFPGGLGWSPEPTGQPRYVFSANVYGHAPN